MTSAAKFVSRDAYIFYDIPELYNYSNTNFPRNEKTKLVGIYKHIAYKHYLYQCSKNPPLQQENVDLTSQIELDFSTCELFPDKDDIIECYGILDIPNRTLKPILRVSFYKSLGHESSSIEDYLNCLRTIRKKFVEIECWNPTENLK